MDTETTKKTTDSVGRAAKSACEMAMIKLDELDAKMTDVMVIAIAVNRRDDGVGTYIAAHYEGCASCISEHAGQIAIDVISNGFLEMTQHGHDDDAHQ